MNTDKFKTVRVNPWFNKGGNMKQFIVMSFLVFLLIAGSIPLLSHCYEVGFKVMDENYNNLSIAIEVYERNGGNRIDNGNLNSSTQSTYNFQIDLTDDCPPYPPDCPENCNIISLDVGTEYVIVFKYPVGDKSLCFLREGLSCEGSYDTYYEITPDGYEFVAGGICEEFISGYPNCSVSVTHPVENLDTGDSFTTIQAAINAAFPGHTLFVHSGTYEEIVTIEKSLTLIGESKDNTIIDGRSLGNVVEIAANGVNIKGFTIQNCKLNYTGDPLYAGIVIDSNNNIVDNNNIRDCHNGVYLYPGTTGNVVSNNTITNDRWCFTGILLYQSSGNKIYSNDITNSLRQGSGIFLQLSSNNVIYANTIHDNHQGIYLIDSSNNNIFHHNNLIDNINYNAYIENSLDTCTGNQWYFQYPSCGNYWSDFTGPDSNNDGIVDTPPAPYNIPGGIGDQDLHPLVAQWSPVCGNVNGDPKGDITIGDISYLIDYLSIEPIWEPEPVPPCAADVDGDGDVTQFDIEYLIAYLFITGQEPVSNCCCK